MTQCTMGRRSTITAQEYAESRGKGSTALYRAADRGRCSWRPGKRLDPERLDEELGWAPAGMHPSSSSEDEELPALAAAKLRKQLADAGLAELKLERERGELVALVEVTELVADAGRLLRTRLLTWPDEFGDLLVGLDAHELKQRLDVEVRRLLGEFQTLLERALRGGSTT